MTKFLSKDRLKALAHIGNLIYGQEIDLKYISSLPSGFNYPVVRHLLGNDDTINVFIALNELGDTLEIKMDVADFNDLPEIDIS